MEHYGNIDKIADRAHTHAPPEASLVAEIASRFIEWRTSSVVLTESKPFKWLQRLARLGRDNPDALWLYLSLQTGDLSALTDTCQNQAADRALDRQAIHQRHQRALADMALHFPELQSVISELDKTFRPPRGINTKQPTVGTPKA